MAAPVARPGAIVVVSDPIAHGSFCGRTLVERHVEILRRCGVDEVIVATAAPSSSTDSPVLTVCAERVLDPRLYKTALAAGRSVTLVDGGQPVGVDFLVPGMPPSPLDITTIDPYSRELRRSLRPYWMAIASAADRPRVRRLLVDASAKGHQELTSRYIDTPVESALLEWLAETRVTPNQLTFLCNVLAYGVAALYATGHLALGAVGAMVVAVVDGLDGRQARIQLRTSEFGRVEHLLDKAYEIAWIGAIAYALSSGGTLGRYAVGFIVWVAAYLSDSAAYDLFKLKRRFQLDEATPTDAAIRLVAGRRNIYTYILLVGVLLQRPHAAFWSIVIWAMATATVHWIRVVVLLRDVTELSCQCHRYEKRSR